MYPCLQFILLRKIDQLQVPFATQHIHLIGPMAAIGVGKGMVDACIMPELANICDIRHSNIYGGVYAIADVAFCLAFAVGMDDI